jgi:hypothetical protein
LSESISINDIVNMITRLCKTCVITIIGSMGSGKSTLAFLLSYYLLYKKYLHEKAFMRKIEVSQIDFRNVEQYFETPNPSKINVFILEDASFLLTSRSKNTLALMNTICRVRHITRSDYNYIFVITHYSRAISPFLRASNVVFLTSISPAEINTLKELFSMGSLLDFLDYKLEHTDRYIYLVRLGAHEYIVDFTLSEKN